MPSVFLNIPDGDHAISRPINFKVARDALAGMGFDESVFIEYTGAGEAALVEGSAEGEQPKKNYFGTDTKATLKVQERPVSGRIYEGQSHKRDQPPFFADRELFVFLRPSIAPYETTLSFELRFSAETEAQKWYNDIVYRSQLARTNLVHKVEYHYPIPQVALFSLYQIHKTKESVLESGEEFKEWFHKCRDPRVQTIANSSGEQLLFVVSCTKVNLQGWYDFQVLGDEPTFDKDKGVWNVSFEYKFLYEREIGVVMDHPITVMNQMLPQEILALNEDYDLSRENVALSATTGAYEAFTGTYGPIDEKVEVGRIPAYDNWTAQLANTWTKHFLFILVGVSKDDRRSLLNLREIAPYEFTSETLMFIDHERSFITKNRRSLLNISLFANDHEMIDVLTLDEDMNLSTTVDLELAPVYHLRFSWLTNLDVLSREDDERLRTDACEVYKLMTWLYPHLVANGMIPSPSARCRWSESQWEYIRDVTRPPDGGGGPTWPGDGGWYPGYPGNLDDLPRTPTPPTVGIYGIIARRMEDANSEPAAIID